jgi:hypothetical protein
MSEGTYTFDLDFLPVPEQRSERQDNTSQGVHFTFDASHLDFLLATLERWFGERDEVILVDYGTTDKQGLGCIIMEWDGCNIDQLFLDILRTDDTIIDYTVYDIEFGGDDE